MAKLARARTSVLELAYEDSGPADALLVFLLHGYPYDVRAFDEVVPVVNGAGYRTIVPYLRSRLQAFRPRRRGDRIEFACGA
jgi:pimeloyl-ACP methyl ester carboxylesterase